MVAFECQFGVEGAESGTEAVHAAGALEVDEVVEPGEEDVKGEEGDHDKVMICPHLTEE